jgi:hypothetical protein
MTTYAKFGRSALFAVGLLTPGCTLLGVEPDEIDIAEETGTGLTAAEGDGDGDTANGTDTTAEEAGGDGDGDPGDGDGDPTSTGDGDGDGDGDSGDGDPGDGDGDGDGDRDTGDGDGDGGDGDGDQGVPCGMYEPIAVEEAENAIDIPDVMSSFAGSCGAPGPDDVFIFTATSDATYGFTLGSDEFEGVLYLVAGTCNPLDEIACEHEGQSIMHDMLVGEVVYIIVDSSTGPGAAILTIAAI